MKINKEKTVAFIGSRTAEILSSKNDINLLNVLSTETFLTVASLYKQGFRVFLCEMSDGFDKIAAEAVLKFKKERSDIELVTVAPNSEEYLLANSSQVACYYDNQHDDAATICNRAIKEGMPTTNLFNLLSDYIANNSPAKQALQRYNSIDGFSYCKEGVMLSYLYGEEPVIVDFKQIERVENRNGKLYLTLINGLEVDAYILS